jgi:hypothetical protein
MGGLIMWKAFWYGFWVIVKAVFSALGIVGVFAGGLWLLMIFFEGDWTNFIICISPNYCI